MDEVTPYFVCMCVYERRIERDTQSSPKDINNMKRDGDDG